MDAFLADNDDDSDEQEEKSADGQFHGMYDPSSSARSVPSVPRPAPAPTTPIQAPTVRVECRTCCFPLPAGVDRGICLRPGCGLRADLEHNHSINLHLVAERHLQLGVVRVAASPLASTASSSSSSSSTSSVSSPPPPAPPAFQAHSDHSFATSGNLTDMLSAVARRTDTLTYQQKEENTYIYKLNRSAPNPRFASLPEGAATIGTAGAASFIPNTTPVTPTAAIAFMQQRFGGPSFVPPSKGFCALIQAGLLENPADAVPRTLTSERALKDSHNIKLSAGESGLSITAGGIVKRQIAGADQLKDAYINTITPALIEQPTALLDWAQFVASVSYINNTHGWSVAEEYMKNQLHANATTGRLDDMREGNQMLLLVSLQSAAKLKLPATPAPSRERAAPKEKQPGKVGTPRADRPAPYAQPQQRSTPPQQPRAPAAPPVQRRFWDFTAADRGCCRDWNGYHECKALPCVWKHRCLWTACTTRDDGHRGQDCSHVAYQAPRERQGPKRE